MFAVPFYSVQDCSDRGAFRACGSVIHLFSHPDFSFVTFISAKNEIINNTFNKEESLV